LAYSAACIYNVKNVNTAIMSYYKSKNIILLKIVDSDRPISWKLEFWDEKTLLHWNLQTATAKLFYWL